MTRAIVTRGTGITRREEVKISMPSNGDGLASALRGDFSFEGRARILEAEAKITLERAGLPSDPSIWYDPITGTPQEKPQFPGLVGLVCPRNPEKNRLLEVYEIDSPEGYAARLLTKLYFVRRYQNSHNIDLAVLFAFELGGLNIEMAAKRFLEPKVLDSLGMAKGRSKGGGHRKKRFGIQEYCDRKVAGIPKIKNREAWNMIRQHPQTTGVAVLQTSENRLKKDTVFDIHREYDEGKEKIFEENSTARDIKKDKKLSWGAFQNYMTISRAKLKAGEIEYMG